MRRKYGVKCHDCSGRIFSWYRHDFRYCKCGKTFIDGGDDYLRIGWETKRPRQIYHSIKQDGPRPDAIQKR